MEHDKQLPREKLWNSLDFLKFVQKNDFFTKKIDFFLTVSTNDEYNNKKNNNNTIRHNILSLPVGARKNAISDN